MPAVPRTQYAEVDGSSIAYQVFGDGPRDLIWTPGFVSHLDLQWASPDFARFAERLGSFARVIVFDKRGTGLSDPTDGAVRFDRRIDDITAVMDAAGVKSATLFGVSEGGPLSALFAATHPERVESLILFGTFSRGALLGELLGRISDVVDHWGEGRMAELLAPPATDVTDKLQAMGLFERAAASPGMARALLRSIEEVDVTPALLSLSLPCLVLHQTGDPFLSVEHGRQLAAVIPGAVFREYPGVGHAPFEGDFDVWLDDIERFVTGEHATRATTRSLATVLFTDIVGSTEKAATLGDAGWRQLLEQHNAVARKHFARHSGQEVKTMGDGFLVTFASPTRAIECARAMVASLREIDIEIRTGIHTGECDVIDEHDIAGMAVNIAARVMDVAGAGDVSVSGTVKDLVVGSDYSFDSRGSHELKGVPGRWEIWTVADRRAPYTAAEIRDRPLRASDRIVLFLARRAPRAMQRLAAMADR